MKKAHLFVAGATLLLLTACSPKVVTHISKTYPDVIPADSVHVIEPGGMVPNTAETIGRVAVVDRGFSNKCRYDQVLRLAQEATGKNGGNGACHYRPSGTFFLGKFLPSDFRPDAPSFGYGSGYAESESVARCD